MDSCSRMPSSLALYFCCVIFLQKAAGLFEIIVAFDVMLVFMLFAYHSSCSLIVQGYWFIAEIFLKCVNF